MSSTLLLSRPKNTSDRLDTVQIKLGIAVIRRVPPEAIRATSEVFELWRNPVGAYKAIRCQRRALTSSVNKCVSQGYNVRAYSKIDPNAISIFNRVRDQMPASIGGVTAGYFLTLRPRVTEAQLLAFIATIDAQRAIV